MRIGFDGKRFFHNNTGLGNYSRSLIKVLSEYLPENKYLLYNPKKSSNYSLNNFNKSVIEVNPENYLANPRPFQVEYFECIFNTLIVVLSFNTFLLA